MESRSRLLSRAKTLASKARLLVVYGPTGSGKTSLLRSLAEAWSRGSVSWVDAASVLAESGPGRERVQPVLDSGGSPLDIHLEAEAQGATLTIIDHVDLLPRYRAALPEARLGLLAADLQAASNHLARRLRRSHLVVATSEASVGSLLVRRRLAGGPATHLYVPGLPWEEAAGLYREIASGCGVGAERLHELTRGMPGLARAACEKGVEEWLSEARLHLESALVYVASQLERTLSWSVEPSSLPRLLSALEEGDFAPLEKPYHYALAEALAPYNIAYIIPVLSRVRVELHPPVHAVLEPRGG